MELRLERFDLSPAKSGNLGSFIGADSVHELTELVILQHVRSKDLMPAAAVPSYRLQSEPPFSVPAQYRLLLVNMVVFEYVSQTLRRIGFTGI